MTQDEKRHQLIDQLRQHPLDTSLLNDLGHLSFEQGKISEAVDAFSRSLASDPSQFEILFARANAFIRLGNLPASLEDLYLVLQAQPNNLEVRDQIRFIHRKLVGAWHFGMMNDDERNLAYEKAIKQSVKPGMTVFEVGTGSGLLAMMAARAGASHVYTSEKVAPIRKAAREIIRRNKLDDRITLLDKWSTAVSVGVDLPERVDLVIGEIFGPALLDEQALHFFNDAKARLLKPNGAILPLRATMHGMLIESQEIHRRAVVGTASGFDLSLFNALHDDPALQLALEKFKYVGLSTPFAIGELVFGTSVNDFRETPLEVVVTRKGLCHGIAQWFRLETAAGIFLDTSPLKALTHWEQHVQLFVKPIEVVEGAVQTFTVRQMSDRFSLVWRNSRGQ